MDESILATTSGNVTVTNDSWDSLIYQSNIYKLTDNTNLSRATKKPLKPKKVIFNNPATIVFWNDNTKTVVKWDELTDDYDKEKAFAMCCAKKLLGNNYNYYSYFDRFVWKNDSVSPKER